MLLICAFINTGHTWPLRGSDPDRPIVLGWLPGPIEARRGKQSINRDSEVTTAFSDQDVQDFTNTSSLPGSCNWRPSGSVRHACSNTKTSSGSDKQAPSVPALPTFRSDRPPFNHIAIRLGRAAHTSPAKCQQALRMPHAVAMPSFLDDDSGTMLSSSPPSYDNQTHLRQLQEKTNGYSRSSTRTSTRGSFENGMSQHLDGSHGSKPQTIGENALDGNSNINHISNLNFLPNGRTSSSSWDYRSSRNGSTISVSGMPNGINENGRRSPGPQSGLSKSPSQRESVYSTNAASAQPASGRATFTAAVNGESSHASKAPVPSTSNPQSTGPLTYSTALLPRTPGSDSQASAAPASPHRFSSPPTYNAQSTPSTTGGSASQPHPGAMQLKHRHTLQVPKATTGRNSRDSGDEVVSASGRFSPTATGAASSARRGSLSLNRRQTQSIHSNLPHDEIAQDEDAARWAEAIRQKRASKRRKKDDEDDDRVVVGTKVDQFHVNWVTAYNMLTGIRFTVSRTNAKMDRPLTDADFEAKHKFSFDM